MEPFQKKHRNVYYSPPETSNPSELMRNKLSRGFTWISWQVWTSCLQTVAVAASIFIFPGWALAQSPELSMREFSSAQIKKGVRSIGFGGDGATWGNYALVWKDAGGALVDYADTAFTNGNDFHFSAVGVTSPSLWHDLAVYLIVLDEGTNDVHFTTKSPGLGPGATPLTGSGSDH